MAYRVLLVTLVVDVWAISGRLSADWRTHICDIAPGA
jgi:hypothetical protein